MESSVNSGFFRFLCSFLEFIAEADIIGGKFTARQSHRPGVLADDGKQTLVVGRFSKVVVPLIDMNKPGIRRLSSNQNFEASGRLLVL